MTGNSKVKILVAGASGYVGGRLVPRLIQNGHQVRCLARKPEILQARNWEEVEIVQGDVLNLESLENALKNIDVAYYLVHSMKSKGKFEDRDAQGAKNFRIAANSSGIKRIIYLGGLAKESPELSSHLKSRQEVGDILRESGVEVTELRASIIIGSGSASFEIIRDLVKKLPIMVAPRWVRSLCEPISIRNILEYLVACLEEPRTINEILEIGCGQKLSYHMMIRKVAAIMGKKVWMIPVPVLTPRLSAYWLNLVTTVPMGIAYPLIEGLRNDSVCTDHRIKDWIKLDIIPFEDAVQRALQNDILGDIKSRWTEASNLHDDPSEDHQNQKSLMDVRQFVTDVSSDKLFQIVQQIGGDVGWYYANWIWKLRGIMDRIFGGVGMRRGRRHPIDVRVGDTIDFWRVEAFKPGEFLKLKAEMKLPGKAWLDFQIKNNEAGQTVFTQIATFLPKNWFGTLYWYAVLPAHYFVFKNMAINIIKRAKQN